MSWFIYYKESKKSKNKHIMKEILWRKFVFMGISIFENYDTARSFINYIWKNQKKPKYIDEEFIQKKYEKICLSRNYKYDIGNKIEFIKKEFIKYRHNLSKTYNCKFSNHKLQGKNELQIPKFDLSRRKALGYKWTAKEEVYATIKHYLLYEIAPGNQWTLINDIHMAELKKENYNIEVFGSPFNTRLQYFGSLYKCDEPFGRIGTYEEILDIVEAGEELIWRDKNIKYDKLLISPPSGQFILNDLCKRSIKILKNRKIEIYICFPAYNNIFLDFYIKNYKKYIIFHKLYSKAWDFYAFLADLSAKNTDKSDKKTKPNIIGKVYNEERIKKSEIKNLVEINLQGRDWFYILLRS